VSAAFVADASIGFAWIYPAQASEISEQLLQEMENGSSASVSTLWPLEIANGILVLVRHRRMSASEGESALTHLRQIPVDVDLEAPALALTRIAELARDHDLSTYDAAYLELAIRKELPLATRDEALAKAARRCGIRVL
jgi:predicted nucleic acid-binding protein